VLIINKNSTKTKMRNLSILFTVLLVLLVLLVILSTEVEADIVSDIKNINSDAAIEYPEADDIKQDLLLLLYSMDRTKIPEDVRQFSLKMKDFLDEFNKIYLLSRKGNATEKGEAIKKIVLLKTLVPKADEKYLPESDASVCAKNMLEKFVGDEAAWFENKANNEKNTYIRIKYYWNASYAYGESGNNIKKEQIKILAANLEAKYKKDMEEAYSAYSEGERLMQSYNLSNSSTIIDKINTAVAYNQVLNKYSLAKEIYDYHGEEDKSNKVKEQINELKQILPILYGEAGNFLIVFLIVLSSIIVFLFERINEWKKAMYDVSLGEEVFKISI